MASLDFYALAIDAQEFVDFLFRETDIVIYELTSEFDEEVRCFSSAEALRSTYRFGGSPGVLFQLWSPSAVRAPLIRKIDLPKETGHRFRYAR